MGQIVFNRQKPKYCNLASITTGNHATDVPKAGEIWLIDSTNASKSDGTGKYDYYIVGDNSHTASQLAQNKIRIDDNDIITIDDTPTSGSNHAVSSDGVYQAIQAIDVSSQISGKADKSEMSVIPGSGADADKTTIQLKQGTTATVLTQHQDITGKANSSDVAYLGGTVDNTPLIKKLADSNGVQFYPQTDIDAIVDNDNIVFATDDTAATSAQASQKDYLQKFVNKKFAIIGDSISTYSGWLPSSISGYDGTSYAIYYPNGNVNAVELTWWYKAFLKIGITPSNANVNNCSWSGSKVTGDSTSTSSASAACSTRRISDLSCRGWNPDIIIIFISCNDWASNTPLGNWQISDAIPSEGTISEARAGYALMLNKIHVAYPNARIFCCTILDDYKRDKTTGWPSNNTSGVTTYQWNQNIKEIAEAFGCDVIDLHSCGFNYSNISSLVVDEGLHPNVAGMEMMAQKVACELIAKY